MEKIELEDEQDIQDILSKYGDKSGFPFDNKTGLFLDESKLGANDGILVKGNRIWKETYYEKMKSYKDNTKKSRKEKKRDAKKAADSATSAVIHKPYRNFSDNIDAYKVAEALGVRICAYCNENYAYVLRLESKKITRPEFDHFETKKRHPEKQLFLKNLVPSCHVCNSNVKGSIDFGDGKHLNPYEYSFDDIMKFSIQLQSIDWKDEKNFKIVFLPRKKRSKLNCLAKGNIEDLKLEERYQMHKDEVIKIFKNANFYYKERREEINELLTGNRNRVLPLEQILFPDKDCSIKNTSLGKLKRDIIRLAVK